MSAVPATDPAADQKSKQNRILELVVFLILGTITANSAMRAFHVVADDYITTPKWKIVFYVGLFLFFAALFTMLVWLSIESPGGKPF